MLYTNVAPNLYQVTFRGESHLVDGDELFSFMWKMKIQFNRIP